MVKNIRQVKKTTDVKGPQETCNVTYNVLPPLDGSQDKLMEVEWFRETKHSDQTPIFK